MDNKEWLGGLKVGDTAIVKSYTGMGVPLESGEVTKITKTQVQVTLHRYKNVTIKFRRDDGREIGGNIWHSKNIIQPTDEIWSEIRAYKKRDVIYGLIKNIEHKRPNLVLVEHALDRIIEHLVEADKIMDDAIEKE